MPSKRRPKSGSARGLIWLTTLVLVSACQTSPDLTGVWTLDKDNSTDIDSWRSIELRITANDNEVSIGRLFNPRRFTRHDSVTFPVDDTQIEVEMAGSAKWFEQPHLGVFIEEGTPQQIRGMWQDPGRILNVQHLMTVQTSQGEATVEVVRQYAVSDDGSTMTVTENRSSRPDTLTYVYHRNEQ